uniref:Uncharacterized protein n=1 Tax=Knipowitschia caucasica TaxID=637954 RepID=A0AAV2KLM1_KNICA
MEKGGQRQADNGRQTEVPFPVEEVMKLNDGEAKSSGDIVYLAGVKYIVLQDQLSDDDDPHMAVKTLLGVDGGKCYNGCIFKTKE